MKKKKWPDILKKVLAVFVIFSSVISASSVLASENAENDSLKTVRVGYLLYDGYQEGSGDEPKSGYGYEYLQQIAYYAGWKYEYVNGSFQELLQMLKDGEIDIMGDLSYTEERAKYINYATEEEGREYYYLFAREDRTDIVASDLSTLNGTRVGINAGSVQAEMFEEWCEDNHIDCEIVLYEDSEKRYQDMNSGFLDATISTNVAGKDIIKFHWNSLIKIGYSPYYFGTNKRRPDILEDLNKANARIQQSDWYYNEKVYLKYYGNTSASAAGLSKTDLDWLKEKKNIVIGYMDETLPYAHYDEDSDKLEGLLPVFMDYINERYGVTFSTERFSTYEQMCDALYSGSIDTMFPTYGSYWIAEENNMMVTDELASSYVLIVYKGNYDSETTSVIAITDKSPTQQFYVKDHYLESDVLRCDTMEDCIRAVLEGNATCTLLCSDVYYANRNEFDRLGDFAISNTGYETTVSFATRKNDIEMYSFMKKCVASITEAEVNEALIAGRHANSELTVKQFLEQHVMIVIVASFVLLLLMASFLGYYVFSSRKNMHLSRKNSELSEKAYIDFSTGLPNKNKCEEMLSSPLPVGLSTGVFMLDLNDLKVVNDTLGHETGDMMIFSFAKILRQTIPEPYFVGRFGGDEFIVIAEGISGKEEADFLLKKMQEIVLNFNSSGVEFKLSYACGFAFSEEYPSANMAQLLNVADQRMYEQKMEIKKQKR